MLMKISLRSATVICCYLLLHRRLSRRFINLARGRRMPQSLAMPSPCHAIQPSWPTIGAECTTKQEGGHHQRTASPEPGSAHDSMRPEELELAALECLTDVNNVWLMGEFPQILELARALA